MTNVDLLLSGWSLDPFAVAAFVAAIVAYAIGARSGQRPRAFYLIAAVATLAIAVASPVGALADGYLFSAHMLQHLLLVLVVPPLFLLSLRTTDAPRGRLARAIERPFVMWVMGVGAMWLWHAPTLCNAASQSAIVHRIQELSLFAMGTAFWWPILSPRLTHRIAPLTGVVYLFSACIACTVLGVIVTFSPVEVCSIYRNPVDRLGVLSLVRGGWGLTPDKDQQLGGLLMWVPGCLVYAVAIMGVLARFYRGERLEEAR
jgi:cytochrome c oxidase assembly factor CtaG